MNAKPEVPPGGRLGPIVLAATAIAGAALCILMIWPFVGAITWALALAILFVPAHARIERRIGNPTVAALISVAILVIVVAVPAVFVIERLMSEAATGATSLQRRVVAGELRTMLDSYPRLAPIGAWIEHQLDLPALAASLATWLSNIGATFVRGSVLQVVEVALTFYLLFYFLRDRHAAKAIIRSWLPLTPAEDDRLFRRVFDTVHATVYGTLAVAAVQGTLGGLMFWALGLPAPLLWGLVMGLLSVIPVLGAFVVWIPASLILALDGSWGKAVVLALWGAVVVGSIDNILRPILVGNRLRLHTVPAFISMIGGLTLFGAPGFILGPLAVTVTMLIMEIWSARLNDTPLPDLEQPTPLETAEAAVSPRRRGS
ncbi:AI-2E family transporter [Mesorhizobium sp. J428]|uniref:AI-2E family transporter n=1 Tax=Mesorhizobium sp. J428 TaxID=2898440 RepID=UPI002151D129|nr:AI-2E family transporter [Mesorhizobium sp. J428]MCR5859432.1 AI-2E family transporter [Mesorhizobium sp. J428]